MWLLCWLEDSVVLMSCDVGTWLSVVESQPNQKKNSSLSIFFSPADTQGFNVESSDFMAA